MDAGAKKKSSKADFDNAIKGNEEIRNMKFHEMNFDELENKLETRIVNSKFKHPTSLKFYFYREGIDSRPSYKKARDSW